jgi:hypothetical protein
VCRPVAAGLAMTEAMALAEAEARRRIAIRACRVDHREVPFRTRVTSERASGPETDPPRFFPQGRP